MQHCMIVSLSLQQAEEKQRNNSSGSFFSSRPGSAVPSAQSDSVPCSPKTPPDTPFDLPKARRSVFSRLGPMPAPTSHTATDQVSAQHLFGPNRHNVSLTDGDV